MDVMRVGAFQESGVSDSHKNNDVGVGLVGLESSSSGGVEERRECLTASRKRGLGQMRIRRWLVDNSVIVLDNVIPLTCIKEGSETFKLLKIYVFQLYWGIIDEDCMCLRSPAWWFNIYVHCEMITTIKFISLSVTSHPCHFVCVWPEHVSSTVLADPKQSTPY